MALGVRAEEGDWAGSPATKADLTLVRVDLMGMVKDVEGKVKDVEGKIKDVEGKIKDVEGIVKDFRVEMTSEIAKLRVSMAWMTVGVVMGLGGLIALFEFL